MPEVVFINNERGNVVVELQDGLYSVVQISDGSQVNKGDMLSGTLDNLGITPIYNKTSRKIMAAIVQYHSKDQKTAFAIANGE